MIAAMLCGGEDDRNPLPPSGGLVHNVTVGGVEPYTHPEDSLAQELINLGRRVMGTHVHRRLNSLVDVGSSQPPEAVIIPPGFTVGMYGTVEYHEPTLELHPGGFEGLSDLPSLLEQGVGRGYEIGFQFQRLSDKEGTILTILDTSRPTGHPGAPQYHDRAAISATSWPEHEFGHRVWYDESFETPAAVVFRQTEAGHGGSIYAMFPTRDHGWGVHKYFQSLGYPAWPGLRLGYSGHTDNWDEEGWAEVKLRVWDAGGNKTAIWPSGFDWPPGSGDLRWSENSIVEYPTGTTANGTPPSSPVTLDGVLHTPISQFYGRTSTWDGVCYLANVEAVYTASASHVPGNVIPTIRAGGTGNFGTIPGGIRGFYVIEYVHETDEQVAAL